MAGWSTLQRPLTPGQHIASIIAEFEARISDLERTRPVVSVGTSPPTSAAPIAGSQHIDTNLNQVWTYNGTKWVTSDHLHVLGETLSTYSTSSSSVQNVGPSISLPVETGGKMVFVRAEAELLTPDATVPRVALVSNIGGGPYDLMGVGGNPTNTWMFYSSWAYDTPSSGDGGTWLAFRNLSPNTYNFSLGYYAAGGTGTVQFRNRRIFGVVI